MVTIHLPVKFKPSTVYWLPSFHTPEIVQKHFDEIVDDMNEQAYLKIVKQIEKIGDHFKFSKSELKKLIKSVDKKSVAGYITDSGEDNDENEPVQWSIFNEFYRLVVDTKIKNCIITNQHDYFKDFNSKCLIKFNEHYTVMDVYFYLSCKVDNKERAIEIRLDKDFNLISIHLTKIKYNKKSATLKEKIIEGDELNTLSVELDNAAAFYN